MKSPVLIDWLTFTVLDAEGPDAVIKDYLKMDPGLFAPGAGYVRGYYQCKAYGNISVGHGPFGFAKGVCVSMSGQGCRQFEQTGGVLLPEQGKDSLVERLHISENVNVTRIDLAADDMAGKLDMALIAAKVHSAEVRSRLTTYSVTSSKARGFAGAIATTAYVGAKSSDLRFRIYDKAKEHYDPLKDKEGFNNPWVRVEMVCKGDYAESVVGHLCNDETAAGCFGRLIRGHLDFIEKDDKNISRCTVSAFWQEFLETLEKALIHSRPEKPGQFAQKREWFFAQLGAVAAMLMDGMGPQFWTELRKSRKRMTRQQETLLASWLSSQCGQQGETYTG